MYEIQVHPADIRKQVRYYFLSRKVFRWLTVFWAAIVLLLAAVAVLAPLGLRSLLLTGRLHTLSQQHSLQHEILAQRSIALDRLEKEVATARALQRQMSLILGAPQESSGLGGYPEEAAEDLQVAEAQLAVRRSVKLDTESWDRIVTWIDLNAPYHGYWHEIVGERAKKLSSRQAELRELYAGVNEDLEIIPEIP